MSREEYYANIDTQDLVERRDPVVPTVPEEDQTLLSVVDAFLEMMLPSDRYGDPDDLLDSALF